MLFSLFILGCGAGLAVLGSLTFWPVTGWETCYIPVVLCLAGLVAGVILALAYLWFIGLFVSFKKEYNTPNRFYEFTLTHLIQFALFWSGVSIKVIGEEKLPKNQKYVLICNHRSNYDSLVFTAKYGSKHLAFIAKDSLFRIPFLPKLIWATGYVPIVRTDLLKSLAAIKRATAIVSSGTSSIGVFPEGTRQHEATIGNFHEGCFNIAIKGGVPLIIATLKNTYDIHKRAPFRRTRVIVEFLKTYSPDELVGVTAKAISDESREMMIASLKR